MSPSPLTSSSLSCSTGSLPLRGHCTCYKSPQPHMLREEGGPHSHTRFLLWSLNYFVPKEEDQVPSVLCQISLCASQGDLQSPMCLGIPLSNASPPKEDSTGVNTVSSAPPAGLGQDCLPWDFAWDHTPLGFLFFPYDPVPWRHFPFHVLQGVLSGN